MESGFFLILGLGVLFLLLFAILVSSLYNIPLHIFHSLFFHPAVVDRHSVSLQFLAMANNAPQTVFYKASLLTSPFLSFSFPPSFPPTLLLSLSINLSFGRLHILDINFPLPPVRLMLIFKIHF